MGRPRLPDEAKRLQGTFEPGRAAPVTGRVRLAEPLAPPDNLDAVCKREWELHMRLCVAAGTIAWTDLRAFQALVESAALAARGYKEAMSAGPIVRSDRGSKVSPEWQAWKAAATQYGQMLDRFGLAPMSARMIPQLPPAKGTTLREVC